MALICPSLTTNEPKMKCTPLFIWLSVCLCSVRAQPPPLPPINSVVRRTPTNLAAFHPAPPPKGVAWYALPTTNQFAVLMTTTNLLDWRFADYAPTDGAWRSNYPASPGSNRFWLVLYAPITNIVLNVTNQTAPHGP